MAELTYQERMKALSEIVDVLEMGTPSLEDTLTLYEEGMKLLSACEEALDAARKRVMILNEDNTQSPFE